MILFDDGTSLIAGKMGAMTEFHTLGPAQMAVCVLYNLWENGSFICLMFLVVIMCLSSSSNNLSIVLGNVPCIFLWSRSIACCFAISIILSIFSDLNSGSEWAKRPLPVMMRTAFFCRISILCRSEGKVRPQTTQQ